MHDILMEGQCKICGERHNREEECRIRGVRRCGTYNEKNHPENLCFVARKLCGKCGYRGHKLSNCTTPRIP